MDVCRDEDYHVRSVDVRTQGGTKTRPTVKLCLWEEDIDFVDKKAKVTDNEPTDQESHEIKSHRESIRPQRRITLPQRLSDFEVY